MLPAQCERFEQELAPLFVGRPRDVTETAEALVPIARTRVRPVTAISTSINGATSPAPRAIARIMPVIIPGMARGTAGGEERRQRRVEIENLGVRRVSDLVRRDPERLLRARALVDRGAELLVVDGSMMAQAASTTSWRAKRVASPAMASPMRRA